MISGAAPASVVAGSAYNFQPTASDPDGDSLGVALKAYKTENNDKVGRSNGVMAGVAKQFTNDELRTLKDTTILLAFTDITARRAIEREKAELLAHTEQLVRQKQVLLRQCMIEFFELSVSLLDGNNLL